MKYFLGVILVILLFTVVFVGGGLIWYLSDTAQFSNKNAPKTAAVPPAHR